MNTYPAIISTRQWLKSFIIEYNICPFAQCEYEKNSIRYTLADGDFEECLLLFIKECEYLDSNPETETTLLIFPNELNKFTDYLDFLDIAQQLLHKQGYEGTYQLASFHPQYCFADSAENDAANYTNRSPYPMLHIIREASIEKALQYYPNPENIPERNIQLTRKMGLNKVQALLTSCKKDRVQKAKERAQNNLNN